MMLPTIAIRKTMSFRYLALVLLFGQLYGQCPPLDVYVEAGFHAEQLSWKLHGKKKALRENFSSVEWNRIYAPEVRLGVLYRFHPAFLFVINAGALLSNPSSNQFRATYTEEHGCRPFKSSNSIKSHISGNDFSLAFGYIEKITPWIELTTSLGYAEQRRKLCSHPHAFSTNIDTKSDPQSLEISDLYYRALWQGPWIGLKIDYALCEDFHFLADAQYHCTYLKTKGHWKTHETLSDHFTFDNESKITQRGLASGFKVNASLTKALDCHWKIGLHTYYELLIKLHGNDSTKTKQRVLTPASRTISQGSFQTHPGYQVHWQAWAILGGIDYEF
jgi:hypothetical protein